MLIQAGKPHYSGPPHLPTKCRHLEQLTQLQQLYGPECKRLIKWANTPTFHLGVIFSDRQYIIDEVTELLQQHLPSAQLITQVLQAEDEKLKRYPEFMEPFLGKADRAS